MSRRQVYLGIDPGFADMGYGVIAMDGGKSRCLAYGSITTPKEMPPAARLKAVYDGLADLIRTHRPGAAGVEKLFFSTNAKTAMRVAEARGVILVCLENLGIRTAEFSPGEVKIAVCGHGRAEKKEMQKMVRMLLGLKEIPKPDDAADALAIALALAFTRTPVTDVR